MAVQCMFSALIPGAADSVQIVEDRASLHSKYLATKWKPCKMVEWAKQ